MAIVYLAQDLKHDRTVAIKVLSPDFAAMLGPERFFGKSLSPPGSTNPTLSPSWTAGIGKEFVLH